jgi:hypothetical protein
MLEASGTEGVSRWWVEGVRPLVVGFWASSESSVRPAWRRVGSETTGWVEVVVASVGSAAATPSVQASSAAKDAGA